MPVRLNSKITRSLDLQAKTLMAQAQKLEDDELETNLMKERARRMAEVPEYIRKEAEKVRRRNL